MKKLLTLFLVLGLSSMASALTVNLSLDGSTAMGTTMDVDVADLGDAISLSVISDTSGVNGIYYNALSMYTTSSTEPATITNVTYTTKAGDLGAVTDYSYMFTNQLYFSLVAGGTTVLPSAGVQFTFDLTPSTSLEVGDTFDFWITVPNDDNATPSHTVAVTIVPEPMTILLLGIGGLFLRRRK